mgnify:CR=1 FL=1
MPLPFHPKRLFRRWVRIRYFFTNRGKAQPVEIQTGIRTEAETQVLQGLQEGDTIIISGTLQLRTGLPVTLDNIY